MNAGEVDVLVVGRGAAGCMASMRLARRGAEVLLIGRDATATALSAGRLDLAGVDNPELPRALRALGLEHGLFQAPRGARRAITNQGTVGRQTLSSVHDWLAKDAGGPTAVVGLQGNPDLDPASVCSALGHRGLAPACRPYRWDLCMPGPLAVGRGPVPDEAREAIDRMADMMEDLGEDTVVLPPLFEGPGHASARSALELASGRKVREAATPLSAPGRRLMACLEDGAARSGVERWCGRELIGLEMEGGEAVRASVRSGLREVHVVPKAVILATGNLVAGGLIAEGDQAVDPLGLFATATADRPGVRSPALRRALSTGLAERGGRAVLRDGTAAGNVFVAGSARAGMSYPLGRGLGQVLADAWTKAELLWEEAI